jgi:histone H3/H4
MTPEERILIAVRMMNIERMLSTTIPAIRATAKAAQEVEALGLATASYLLAESVEVYATEMRKFVDSLDQS